MQMGAPNSPQWFNTGLHWAYGIDGPGQGHYYVDYETGKLTVSASSYEHPQPHACFIQSVEDDLVNENGIMDLWVREARLFKYGSGTGSNFSNLRGVNEKLSGGGKLVGPHELPQDRRPRGGRHQVGRHDAARGQDGRGRRRSSRYRGVHRLEGEGGAEGRGPRHRLAICQRRLEAVMKACVNCEAEGDACFDPAKNPALKRAIKEARRDEVPNNYILRVIQFAKQGYTDIEFPTYDTDWDSEAYLTVSGPELQQLGARHRRVPATPSRTTGTGSSPRARRGKTVQDAEGARPVGPDRLRGLGLGRSRHPVPHHDQRLAHVPQERADPRVEPVLGVHVPRRHGLQPRVAEPDDVPQEGGSQRQRGHVAEFDTAAFEHACRLWTIVLEISVLMAQFPSRQIAELSYRYRTLGLGFANIGGLLMASGIPYDSARAAPSAAPSPPS